jgi:hypothetical protein
MADAWCRRKAGATRATGPPLRLAERRSAVLALVALRRRWIHLKGAVRTSLLAVRISDLLRADAEFECLTRRIRGCASRHLLTAVLQPLPSAGKVLPMLQARKLDCVERSSVRGSRSLPLLPFNGLVGERGVAGAMLSRNSIAYVVRSRRRRGTTAAEHEPSFYLGSDALPASSNSSSCRSCGRGGSYTLGRACCDAAKGDGHDA